MCYLGSMAVRDGVDERIEVESWQVRVLRLDIDHRGCVVPGEVDVVREGVVQIRKEDSILCPDRLANYNLIDVVKFIPIFISAVAHTYKH